MKKILFIIAITTSAIANAQVKALSKAKFTDNLSIGVKVGAQSKTTHNAVLKNASPVVGIELTKQISPAFSLGVEGLTYLNSQYNGEISNLIKTDESKNIVKANLLGAINLCNLFGGYTGTPRFFETEAVIGLGYSRVLDVKKEVNVIKNVNSLNSKLGLNFLFNLGQEKAWSIKISPALVYDLNKEAKEVRTSMNINASVLEATAGLVYHFKGSNKAHHFTAVRPYDQAEVDGLNASINDLRKAVEDKEAAIKQQGENVLKLQRELTECRNQKPKVQTVEKVTVKEKNSKTLESVVTFGQGKSVISPSQLPNVERIATYLNKYKNARVIIKGYASPEGNPEINARIANARAQAVKTMLVQRYRVDATRIQAEGQGVGDMFSEPDWNRVSIATIEENN